MCRDVTTYFKKKEELIKVFFEIISPWKHIPATLLEKKPFFYVSMQEPTMLMNCSDLLPNRQKFLAYAT